MAAVVVDVVAAAAAAAMTATSSLSVDGIVALSGAVAVGGVEQLEYAVGRVCGWGGVVRVDVAWSSSVDEVVGLTMHTVAGVVVVVVVMVCVVLVELELERVMASE